MCRGHQRLAECVQTSAERGEDTAVMARLESACGQGRLPRRPSARHSRRHLGHRSRLRCCHRPWAITGGPCHGRLSLRLQPATPAPTSSPVVVRECHQDARPSVHLVSPGLLQLTAVRHQRRTTSTPAVGAECCRPPGHRRPSVWPHHTSVTAAALAASPSAGCVQGRGLVHQSLVGLAPAYLADDCRLLSDVGRRPLRSNSNDMRKLLVPRTHNKLGDRSFSAAGPRLWNDLPPGLRRPGLTLDSFRQSLKTHLFGDRSA